MSDKKNLMEFCLRMGDTNLVLGHRLSEWCGHGPILEQDIALTNVALDLVGQANAYLEYAAELKGEGTADDLAYFRDAQEYRNANLVEHPNEDFAFTMVRQFLFDNWNFLITRELRKSTDPKLAGFAEKFLKEINYHLRHSYDWVQRLGDGTEESHERMQNALNELWIYTEDLLSSADSDQDLTSQNIIPDFSALRTEWNEMVKSGFEKATLKVPSIPHMIKGSRNGIHTEHLGYLLAEMQSIPRAYPGASW